MYKLRTNCRPAMMRAVYPVAGPRQTPHYSAKGATASQTGHDPQIDFLMAAAGNAFTTFEAFFAATLTSLPNIMRFPAGRAALCFSLSITTCGITNFPVLDTSLVAMPDSVVNTLLTSLAFCPVFEEMAAISAPPPMALAPFMAFIAFMAPC